jgi:hypothetical protein
VYASLNRRCDEKERKKDVNLEKKFFFQLFFVGTKTKFANLMGQRAHLSRVVRYSQIVKKAK